MDVCHQINAKQELRKKFLDVRKRLSKEDAGRLGMRIAKNVFSISSVLNADLVVAYYPLGSEVDAIGFMELVMVSGRGVALPYLRGDGEMGIGRIWSLGNDLVPGPFGMMEPADRFKDNVSPKHVGAVICPGVAFDETGTRLGRGGGHYDRFLRQVKGRAFIVGCAFDCQISGDPLPAEEHDVRMDAVITESRAFPKGTCPAITLVDEIKASKESGPAML